MQILGQLNKKEFKKNQKFFLEEGTKARAWMSLVNKKDAEQAFDMYILNPKF